MGQNHPFTPQDDSPKCRGENFKLWMFFNDCITHSVSSALDQQRKKHSATFKRIHALTINLLSYFRHPEGVYETDDSALVKEINDLVALHGTDTIDLILQHQMERSLGKLKSADTGSIALYAAYSQADEMLKVEVLNCRNLKAMDTNGNKVSTVSTNIWKITDRVVLHRIEWPLC